MFFASISDYQRTPGGLLSLTENLDLEAAKAHANERVLQILHDRTLEIPDNRKITIERNTRAVEDWLFKDTYFPVWEKWVGLIYTFYSLISSSFTF